jgi:hypothetical protein
VNTKKEQVYPGTRIKRRSIFIQKACSQSLNFKSPICFEFEKGPWSNSIPKKEKNELPYCLPLESWGKDSLLACRPVFEKLTKDAFDCLWNGVRCVVLHLLQSILVECQNMPLYNVNDMLKVLNKKIYRIND